MSLAEQQGGKRLGIKGKGNMKALITGSQGFVGGYLRRELEGHNYQVTGLDLSPAKQTIEADLLKLEQVKAALKQIQPDVIFHLAGQANVALSWKIPQKTIEINVVGALNLLDGVRAVCPKARIVLIGSSDQYGSLGEAGKLIKEEQEMNPQTPYAVSKQAQEELAGLYVKAYGLQICMTRSFNHCGAGQREGFLVSDFAAGIVRVEKKLIPSLKVGNLSARRDFTHVSDVTRAYRLLAEKGQPGETYNVGSGKTVSAKEILDHLCSLAYCSIPVEQDTARLRPSDTPVICCDHTKLTRQTGWNPSVSLDTMLAESLEYFRNTI